MHRFERLFSPFVIKGATFRNRIFLAPMNTNFAEADGSVSQKFIQYYVQRGIGGTGALIVSSAYIDRAAKKRIGSLLLDEDRFIPALREFTYAVHATGAKIFQQLNHNGRLLTSSKDLKTAVAGGVVGPSPLPHLLTGNIPHELTRSEIREFVEKFGRAAQRAQEADFDGVELHGSHGYLINQFYSRYSNRRKDEYGGSLENRMRFAIEVYRRARALTNKDFLIGYRLNVQEFAPIETPLEDIIRLSMRLEEEGIDYLHFSAGNSETPATTLRVTPPGSDSPACYADLAGSVKAHVKVPVIAVGRITTPEVAEKILQEGKADFVALGRALIADPHWPEKAFKGEPEKIRRCIGCNQGCMERLTQEKGITCIHNPEVGREGYTSSTLKKKKVWVIGGGPAGMEAAVVAASRGHRVDLFEKTDELGGQARLAAIPPGKEEFHAVTDHLKDELKWHDIPTHMSFEITADKVIEEKPEVVIMATGAVPLIPDLPGIKRENVSTAWDVLSGKRVGNKVLVVGGGLVGVETALFLEAQEKQVTLIEMLEDIGQDAGSLNRTRLKNELVRSKIEVRCKTKLLCITENGAKVLCDNKEDDIDAQSIILAVGSRPQKSLSPTLQGQVPELYVIGDCASPRKILDAIQEAYDISMKI